MRIAYLSRGHNVYDRRFLEKMVERGHEPYLISYFPSKKVEVERVPVLHYDVSSILRFPRLTSLQIAWHLRRVLKEIAPDILHTGQIQYEGFYGALSGFHPTLSMPWGSDVLVYPDRRLTDRWITIFTLRRADWITCDCKLVKDRIVKLVGYPAERITVFPWGIDLNTFRPLTGPYPVRERLGWEENPVLIMTRSFRSIYGIEHFIEALPAVIRQCPEARAILVGTGPLEEEFRKRIAGLGLTEYVHFAGWVDEEAMAGYLNASDIYVTTSLSDGTSASMLEAMACGLPVVVSDAPAYFEWVDDGVNGFIVPRRDSIRLAERLVQLLEDAALREAMGKHNLAIARERADWERNFSVLEGIYHRLVDSR